MMLTIDLYSDVVCPWCWIGKRRLERVLAEFPAVTTAITWRPYQLRPDMPAGGEDWQQVIATKFGGAERAGPMFERVAEAGREEGITFAFDRITRAPNTLDAHRVLQLADAEGRSWPLAEALYQAYFTDGQDVSDRALLETLAVAVGCDGAAIRALLAGAAGIDAVHASQQEAAALGVTGVPFTVLDGRLAISGAQPDTLYRRAIAQALEA